MNHLRFSPRAAALWLCLLLLASGPCGSHAQISAAYEEPDLTTAVFELNRLSLDPAARSRLASVLSAGLTYYNATLDAKILGVALRLDPANRDARAAAERRKKNELPDAKSGTLIYPAATVVAYLVGQSGGLRAKGGVDNLTLAGCLSDIAADLDPDDNPARYEKSACARLNASPTWAFLKSRPAPGATTLPLLKSQAKIHGLSISELPRAGRTGALMEIIVTAEQARSRQEVGVFTSRPVGSSMQAALDEAWRAVKMRHPGTGLGQHLVLSFGDIYTPKDGPSAGAAFTLALYSLYDPLKLADDAAMTGAMTVDGRVRAVGGIPWKIHAAQAGGCRVVAIPKENAGTVEDVPLLYPANALWKIQIVTVDTLDEALTVMREDRPANVRKALELFASIQTQVGLEAPQLTAAHLFLAPTLKEILRLCPGHASAATMLKMIEGRAASRLTLYTSLDEINRITDACLDELRSKGKISEEDAPLAFDASLKMGSLCARVDSRATDLCSARTEFLRAMARYYGHHPASMETVLSDGLDRCTRAADEVERRMAADPAIAEALRH